MLPLITPFEVPVSVTHDTVNAYGAYAGLAELALRVKPVTHAQQRSKVYLLGKKSLGNPECEPVYFVNACFELLDLGPTTSLKGY